MYFILENADFSADNIGGLNYYALTYNRPLGITWNQSMPTAVEKDSTFNYSASLNSAYYEVTNVTFTMDKEEQNVIISGDTYTFQIEKVTGPLVINFVTKNTVISSGGEAGDTSGSYYLLDKGTYYENMACKNNEKNIYSADGWYTCEKIPVEAGMVYAIPGAKNMEVLDANENFIGGMSSMLMSAQSGGVDNYFYCPSTVSIPTGGVYLTYCSQSSIISFNNAKTLVTTAKDGEYLVVNYSALVNNKLNGMDFERATSFFSVIGYPVKEGKTYKIPYGANYQYLDSSKTVVGDMATAGQTASSSITVPTGSDIAYLTISFKYENIDVSKWSITEA